MSLCDAMHSKVPTILWFCLQRKCADASPVGHISFDPGNGAKSLDQQGPEIWELADSDGPTLHVFGIVWVCLGWWIRSSKSLLLSMIVLLTLAKANIRFTLGGFAVFGRTRKLESFLILCLHIWGKGDGAELDLLNY